MISPRFLAGREHSICSAVILAAFLIGGGAIPAGASGADGLNAVPSKERIKSARPGLPLLDPLGRPVNLRYTPLVLPKDASVRGIELSGHARLYERSKNYYLAASGCALINTTAPTRIDAYMASIYAKPDTSLVVHTEDDVARVLNISDRKRASIRVVLGKDYVDLAPGQEIGIVAGGTKDPQHLITADSLGYRRMKIVPVGSNLKVLLLEFSLDDALKNCYIFQQLKQSPDDVDHKLLVQIVKTAAAVDTMYKKTREDFVHGDSPAPAKSKQGSTKLADQAHASD